MTGWIITSIILSFFVLLMLLPIVLSVKYNEKDGIRIYVKYIFFNRLLTNSTAKKQEKKKKHDGESKAGSKKKRIEFKEIKQTVSIVLDIAREVRKPILKFLRRIVISDVFLRMAVAKEDAAQTAIAYGKIIAWANGAYAAGSNFFKIKLKKIEVYPDYLSEEDKIDFEFSLKVKVRLAFAVVLIFTSAGKALRTLIKNKNQQML